MCVCVCVSSAMCTTHTGCDSDGIIKVADFGLAVEEDNAKGYFRQDKSDSVRLPFKWMALESLKDGVFTGKTDVVLTLSKFVWLGNHHLDEQNVQQV